MKSIANILGQMKDLKRTGWLKRKVPNSESVADHSFGVALITYLMCPENLDLEKCLKMALIHDLAETITGDFTPCDKVDPKTKSENEVNALKRIANQLNKPEIVDLFIEYEKMESEESKFVNQMDKLECVLQSNFYQKNREFSYDKNLGYDSLFDEFFDTAKKKMSKQLCEKIENECG